MRYDQDAISAALLGAKRFLVDNATQLAGVDFTGASKRLDDVIADLSKHAVGQDANNRSAKGETEKQRQLRVTLRTEQMKPIAEIAREDLRTVPEFKALQLPPRSFKGGAFLASATAMADAAAMHKDALLERGLPADFLEQFQASLSTLAASLSDRAKSRGEQIGATKGLVVQVKKGRSVLKVLDALVQRALRGNDALLATWASARTIRRRPGGAPTTPSTTPATSTTSTTTPVSTPVPVAPAA
jgi:hypothetical protein